MAMTMNALGLLFLGLLLGVIPGWITGGFPLPEGPHLLAAVPGLLLVIAGAALIFRVAFLLGRFGGGTPFPFDPPRKLVVQGPFRRMRHPLYAGIVVIALGEALATRSPALLAYAAGLLMALHLLVVLHEEPALRRRFGDVYDVYRAKVPRWIPGRGKEGGAQAP
jgi:protein-S-isoprenylcysteine O-methyltransferase Ste14